MVDPRIAAALTTLRSTGGRRPLVAEVGTAVGLSASRLEHLLKGQTGSTYREHLRDVHLSQAVVLLADSCLRIKEIADRSGYASTASFSRAFKRAFGVSPSQYRCRAADIPIAGGGRGAAAD